MLITLVVIGRDVLRASDREVLHTIQRLQRTTSIFQNCHQRAREDSKIVPKKRAWPVNTGSRSHGDLSTGETPYAARLLGRQEDIPQAGPGLNVFRMT